MSKKLLIYETAVPVTPARHGQHSVEIEANYGFSAGVNAVPLMTVEILRAATEYAVVFTGTGDDYMPAVVLGVEGDQNLYLGADGNWNAEYIPAFIRRYPFVFAAGADKKSLMLCVDEAYPGLNTEGRGERLFTDDGKPTAYVDQVLNFLKGYQSHFVRTQALGRRLKEYDLLEPMTARLATPSGDKRSLTGFMAVNRAKLRDLAPDKLAELARTDELELLYLHLYSMRNFSGVKERLMGSQSAEADETASTGALTH